MAERSTTNLTRMSLSRGNTSAGPDQFVNARRTESYDAASISKLINSNTEQVFGRINIINLIERANLAVTLVNQDNELMGQACFLDYPNLEKIDPGTWEPWLKNCYSKVSNCNSLNTLFLHFFVSRVEYSHGAAEEIITTVFNAVPEVHYIFLLVPKNAYPESALSKIFQQVDVGDSPGIENQVLFFCGRADFSPVLHVRQARVQDHDDLTPIFDRQSNMLSNTYGGFFLAELIEAQDDTMHCLVAELEDTAVGFISLCSTVNLDLLNKCFDLGPLNGLKKPHPDDVTESPKTPEPVLLPKESTEESAETIGPTESVKSPELEDDASKQVTKETEEVAVQRRLSEEMLDYMSEVSGSLSTSRASSNLDKPETASRDVTKGEDQIKTDPQVAKSEPQLPKPATKFVPQYFGESNAFSIQLFCIDEKYEMRSMDLLRAAFKRMPDKDFAIMTVPHLVPEFPLLQKFLRVSPHIGSTLSQELYVFHKMGLTEDILIRDAVTSDVASVTTLVNRLTLKENLLKDLDQYLQAKRDMDGTELRAYVAEVNKQVVGIAILRREEEIEYIRSHYNVEDFIYFNHHGRTEHGHLYHFALNPIFGHLSKFFLKEVLRKSHKTSLYYPLFPPYTSDEAASRHSILTCLGAMVPTRPRRQVVYPLDILEDRAPSKRVLEKKEPFALCHINRKLTLEPKVVINARIVVVGASTVGIAFLETLAFCPHLRFNNLILVSPHGLPGELLPDPLQSEMLGTDHCYNSDDYANISLRTWINVVYGKMTKIDRSRKELYVNNEKLVPYDHLIITTGEQHQYPMPTGLKQNSTVDSPPSDPDRWFVGNPPENLFVVNDEYDAAVSLYKMEKLSSAHKEGKVVVHGNCLRAYCTVEALVKLGVTPSNIVLVKTPDEEVSCFNNPVVEAAVQAVMLDEYRMTIQEGAILAEWQLDADNNITQAKFLTPEGVYETSCMAFFSYTKKRVDLDAFKAVNDACLVFDGKLVIDTSFHTNDIAIRSAGTVTKFQRRYHAEPWTHKNFNSKEVGIELASAMLSLFDPTLEPMADIDDPLKLIPIYRSPKVQAGTMPGCLSYLHIGKPSLSIPQAAQMMNPEYGVVLSTGEPVGKSTEDRYANNYFRLHFNLYNTVETVTCLSKNPIDSSNILCLYGVHQRFLNNIRQRYKEGLINDFYKYFQEAWCLAIYHDRFGDFRDEIRELLVNQPAPDVKSLEEKVREMIEEDLQLSANQRKNLHEIYAESSVKRAVETRLLSFLSYNYYHLPMYAKPGMV